MPCQCSPPKPPTGSFFLSYILISIYFFRYETIVRSSAWPFGHSVPDPSSECARYIFLKSESSFEILRKKCDNLTPCNGLYVKNSAQNKARCNQTIISSKFRDIKRTSRMSNKMCRDFAKSISRQQNIKFQNMVLLESFPKREGHTGQALHYF